MARPLPKRRGQAVRSKSSLRCGLSTSILRANTNSRIQAAPTVRNYTHYRFATNRRLLTERIQNQIAFHRVSGRLFVEFCCLYFRTIGAVCL